MPNVAPSVVSPDYRLVFPDIVQIDIAGQAEMAGKFLVMPDGTLQHPQLGLFAVEGTTISQLQQQIADKAHVSPSQVTCQVAAYRSRVVHLFSGEHMLPTTIPYAGSERVSDLLVRSHLLGTLNGREVSVIRRNTSMGQQEQKFNIDVMAIQEGDMTTNIVLQPNDEVHINRLEPDGVFTKLIPNWAVVTGR